MRRELLLGSGNSRTKEIYLENEEWENLTTVDIDEYSNPDVVFDLNNTPWPFEDDSFDEVHAYDVLEHLGSQGDYKSFFEQFSEIYRILKPDGMLFVSVPSLVSPWLWGDPGHTRYIGPETIVFLNQAEYSKQVGKSQMTDYRRVYKGDFEPVDHSLDSNDFQFILKAIKPSRIDENFL